MQGLGSAEGNQGQDWGFSMLKRKGSPMNNIIYVVGLVVIVIAVLSFFGLG
jgi:hypothetical protein